ncbi:hypothetical protein [Arthrobacter sp. SX1312]|uniref:hypothetical protein n=1 Tax=Arthrobacter sp. SX1312 TaxID=2058896 RepID=UPI000CE55F15|nr:hypothetical protein [Arthrobacter sp. SX1312]
MSGKLNTFVHVHRDGESKGFGPGDTVPEWAAKLITNPNVWETPPTKAEEEPPGAGPGDTSGGSGTAPGGDGAGSTDDQGDAQSPSETPIPPKGGKGSSASAWAAYAASKGFEVDADAKASEIIDALADAGIPTE